MGRSGVRVLLVAVVVGATLGCMRGRPTRSGGGARAGAAPRISGLAEVFGADGCGTPTRTGQVTWSFPFGGQTWNVPMWVPPGDGPHHAVFLLHGVGGGGVAFAKSSGYDRIAADRNAVLVAPDAAMTTGRLGFGGEERFWDNGRYTSQERVFPRDDSEFLDALAKSLREGACVDNVLATGFSNGAAMSLAWACESGVPDAVVAAAGTLMEPVRACRAKPVPTRIYIGSEDVRYLSSARDDKPEYPSSKESADIFAGFNACSENTRKVDVADDTACTTWTGCSAANELCVIRGFPHAWPKGPGERPACAVDGGRDGYAWFVEQVGPPKRG